jgi:glucose-6-phosphate dehydrogenase assembly protein OpcA
MAQSLSGAGTLGSWSARNPDIGTAEAAIRRLRSRARGGAQRTSVVSLVVLTDDDPHEATAAVQVTRALAGRVPGRAIVVSTFADGAPVTRASITVRTIERGTGHPLCVEEVRLQVRGEAVEHLASIVEPWVLPGVPFAVWLPRRLPRSERLVIDADRVLIDGDRLASPIGRDDLGTLSRLPATDLAWVRQEPWRLVLAEAFAGMAQSVFVSGVERIEASGSRAWSAVLAGWLMSRLGLAPAAIGLVEADRAAVHIEAHHSGRQATLTAQAVDHDEVQITSTVGGGPPRQRRLRLPRPSVTTDLEAALTSRPGPDETWKRAMDGAIALLEQQ